MPTPTSLPTNVSAGATGHVSHSNTVHGVINAVTGVPTSTKTASYTLVLSDAGELVEMNVASANTLTVPPNSSVAFPIGTQVAVRQIGAGVTTLTQGAGVTINARGALVATAGQWAEVVLTKRATDQWILIGDLS